MPGLVLRGRYRLDVLIATGGMGEVWRGTDLAIDRRVAIKVVRPEHAGDQDGLARFRAEAHHAGSLSHPNIAQVFDYGEAATPEPGYLVMELVDGLSLTRILDGGPLSPEDVMDIVAQAARGLAAAHRAGLVHRDVKPGNLLVRQDGLVKITDFGIARAVGDTTVTQPGMLIGTPAYLAPERVSGAPASPATDLYSLGVVAYQCLTGHAPFSGEPLVVALAHLDQGMPALPPSVPPGVAALVAELTRQDPAARPPSAWDVALRAEHLRVLLSSPEALSRHGTAAAPLAVPGAGDTLLAGAALPASGPAASASLPPPPGRGPRASGRVRAPAAGCQPAAAAPGAAQAEPGCPGGPGRDRRGSGRVHRLDAGHPARGRPWTRPRPCPRPRPRGAPRRASCPGRARSRPRTSPEPAAATPTWPRSTATPQPSAPANSTSAVAGALVDGGLAQQHGHAVRQPDRDADAEFADAHADAQHAHPELAAADHVGAQHDAAVHPGRHRDPEQRALGPGDLQPRAPHRPGGVNPGISRPRARHGVSASIIFWMGAAATPPITMARPIEDNVKTVPSQTIVVTAIVYAPASRAAHSASSATPQIVLNISSSRRNRPEVADRRSHAAVRSGFPLVMYGFSPADMSGRRTATEARMAIAITVLTSESLAIMARGSPARKLTTMPARLTASMSRASRLALRPAAKPATARTAAGMLLSARDSHRLAPATSCSR